jgi:hypothetical protein
VTATPSPSSPARSHRLEIKLNDVNQLFTSRETAPFHEYGLDQDAEEFIESRAGEFPLRETVVLAIHIPGNPDGQETQQRVESAVHIHFTNCARRNSLEFSRLMADGRRTLVVGVTFLALCLLLAARVFPLEKSGALNTMLHESFVIAGWVALWRPLEICLYDWWPVRKRGKLLHKLSTMPVEVRFVRGGGELPR